ncbi:MAG: CBS domain-containing protein [Porticoccaceae bacterium]|nr:CBS domain-containing protein [Porticoccaceae bacterium]
MLRSVDLSDYMLTNPVTVSAGENVFNAIDVIIEQKVSGVCVVDTDGNLLGVLSELDCLRAILSATYNENGDVGNVVDFMTAEVDSCELHADLVDVADDMIKKGHRRRPVVDNGKLVGQITCRKLLSVVSEFTHTAN